ARQPPLPVQNLPQTYDFTPSADLGIDSFISVFHWPLGVINDKRCQRNPRRFQLQSELFLDGGENRGIVLVDAQGRLCAGLVRRSSCETVGRIVWGPMQIDIIVAL